MKTLIILLITAATALAAVYQYTCPKCGYVGTWNRLGVYKCPTDGSTMFPTTGRD